MSGFKLAAIITIMISFLLVDLLFLFSQAFALDCTKCYPGACSCTVSECANGTLDVYTAACTGTPVKEFVFTNGSFIWTSARTMNYYLQVYCDSGIISSCINLNLTSYLITATTTTTTTTTTTFQKTGCPYDCCVGEFSYLDKYCPEGSVCTNNQCIGSSTTSETVSNQGFQINYSIVGILAIVIIAAVFVFYFFKGRKPEDKWSTLYKKYGSK